MHQYPSHAIVIGHNLHKDLRDVYASYLGLINKDTNQAFTFVGSSLQGKCLGGLFHYTRHSDEVDRSI